MNKSKAIFTALWPDKCWHEITRDGEYVDIKYGKARFVCTCGTEFAAKDSLWVTLSNKHHNPDFFADTPQGAWDRQAMWQRAQELHWWWDFAHNPRKIDGDCSAHADELLELFLDPTRGPDALYEYLTGRE
jgi:hypothetical protein